MKTMISLVIVLMSLIYVTWYLSIRDVNFKKELIKSEGVYIGQVLEVRKEGIVYKTYNGIISIGVNNITNKVIRCFTIHDTDTLKCVKDNIGKDSLVKLEYKTYMYLPIKYGSRTQVINCRIYKEK